MHDGAVPTIFQQEFDALAPAIEEGTAREARKAASTTESGAALFLHGRSEELHHKRRDEKTVAASWCRQRQSVLVSSARNLRAQFHGPSTRKDAEDSERNRCTTELADLLRGTQPPMGQFSAAQPGNQLTAGGRRASTLRSRVRGVKRFLSWLALRYELTYPTALKLTEYLQVRLQEPCNRGSLKGSYHSRVFLESVAGGSPQDRFTDSQLCNVLYQQQSRRPESSQPYSSQWNTWSSAPRRLATIGFSPASS